jgi:DnaJ-class molecular chaperone
MGEHDYYRVLMLNQDASDDEIKRAYRRIALECHPDHHPADPELEERFKRASEAYSVLGNAEERRKYDLRFRRAVDRGAIFDQSDPEAMFWQFLEREGFDVRKAWCLGGGRGCGRGRSESGRNVAPDGNGFTPVHEVSLTRAEAASGVRTKIVIATAGNPRTYTVAIPPGVPSGKEFRLVLDKHGRRSVILRIKIDENRREVTASGTENDMDEDQE